MRAFDHPLTTAQAAHPAAKSLCETIRWDRFRHQRESPEYWQRALGPTVRVDKHQPYFTEFLLEHAQREGFDAPTLQRLELAGLVHDVGESKWIEDGKVQGIGDIVADAKTATTENAENSIANRILETLDINANLRAATRAAYEDIVKGKDPDLHLFFKAIERLEYLNTARTAYFRVDMEDEGSWQLTIRNDDWMIAGVLAHDLPKILDRYASRFDKSVGTYLRESARWIDSMFNYAKTGISLGSVKAEYREPFERARLQWNAWRDEQVGVPTLVVETKGRFTVVDRIYIKNAS